MYSPHLHLLFRPRLYFPITKTYTKKEKEKGHCKNINPYIHTHNAFVVGKKLGALSSSIVRSVISGRPPSSISSMTQ